MLFSTINYFALKWFWLFYDIPLEIILSYLLKKLFGYHKLFHLNLFWTILF